MHSLDKILGNTTLIFSLKSMIATGNLSHGYLVLGDFGVGKKTIVHAFVKAILCENHTGCGACKSCLTLAHNNHPDVIYVARNLEKASVGVDEIRTEIIDTLYRKPYASEKKIYIIEEGDKVTPQGQNALLKSLEEPPEYAMFFIIGTDRNAFLQTVRSRMMELQVKPLPDATLQSYLEILPESKRTDVSLIANFARGSLGQALSLLQEGHVYEVREALVADLVVLPSLPLGRALLLAKKWGDAYKDEDSFFYIIELWYHDLYVARTTKETTHLAQKDKAEEIFKTAYFYSLKELEEKYEAVLLAQKRQFQKANFRLNLEVMLLKLKEKENHGQ
ncbi:MAG: hypothetical protein R3Y53_07460 [Bacillota bacterium]